MIEPEPRSKWSLVTRELKANPFTVISYPGSRFRPLENVDLIAPVAHIQHFEIPLVAESWWKRNSPPQKSDETTPFYFDQDGSLILGSKSWYEKLGEVKRFAEDGLVLRNPRILHQARQAGRKDVFQIPGRRAERRIRVRPFPEELAPLIARYEIGFLAGIYLYDPVYRELGSKIGPDLKLPKIESCKPGTLTTTPAERALYLLYPDDDTLVSDVRERIENNR